MDEYEENPDEPDWREPEDIDVNELDRALRGLTMLGDDTYLGMQATNIAMVDYFIMPLESHARAYRDADDGIDIQAAMFLNAQSQMWLFALYELLRTWRARAKDIVKWSETGGLNQKIAALEREQGYQHLTNLMFADTLKRTAADPSVVTGVRDDLARIHVLFGQLEFLRIALAKHHAPRNEKKFARAPGYARIDLWTGSMQYELSNGPIIFDVVTRRSFADGIRSWLTDRSVPSVGDLKKFDELLRLKPDDVPSWMPKRSEP